ncbi:hypothetical protein [Nocardioides ganghwensis]|jgi:hypothetical protein|uniref:Transmembrane protein n=1 Tax=Nocardioides ganghwensis TaxID=252230 RepID=A0A4Q2SDM6_9ACTN|nr:hypothetical protein [Nocardioides ganghwensis]MBD3946384.1 hypothetical protein [Nocardioides ganghwensis]RYC03142.1 hypothetical protein EUA07_06160 [Nocardioides ganghwensis]
MADGTADDTGTDGTPRGGPSLEMPSFTRRRRKAEGAEPASEAVMDTAAPAPDAPPGPAPAARVRRPLPRPSLAGLPAAAVTGVVVGALGVLLVWLAGVGCEAVRGTSSCGGGPGLLVLVVVLGVLAWTGSLLLRVLAVPDAGSTSVLAVGILAVLVMVFLLGSLEQWWTAVAVPVAAVAAYCSAWWVTTAVVGED